MKRVFLAAAILLVAFLSYKFFFKEKSSVAADVKAGPLASRAHSSTFNAGIDSLLNAYFAVKDAFVNGDSSAAKAAAVRLVQLADSSSLSELKSDTAGIYQSALMQLSDVKANGESLIKQTSLTEMKQDFRMVGENIYPLLKTIHYDGRVLYWQTCPMAFGEDKPANWISTTSEIINPYLGKHHPEYKATMLHCGETKDSILAQ